MANITNEGFVIDDDKPHLGGNLNFSDGSSWAPEAWDYLIKKYNCKTAIDIGGGYGFCTEWMEEKGIDCVNHDGLQHNIDNSKAKNNLLHDITKGPIKHDRVDLVNCIEVVEHIEEKYMYNLMNSLTLGNVVLITHAEPHHADRGHHHVNCKDRQYWINQFRIYGHDFCSEETDKIKSLRVGWHIKRSGLVFKRRA